MKNFNRRRRMLQVEQLCERLALSANPLDSAVLEAGPAGEGETATVSQDGQVLSIIGSDNDDAIEIVLGDAVHRVTVNGDSTDYSVDDINEIIVRADGGTDSVSIEGTDQNESLELDAGVLELRSGTYTVQVSLAETISVGDSPGFDRATIYDTDGDDSLELRANEAKFTDQENNELTVTGFDRVMSFANNGGDDSVAFHGTSADDTFIGKSAFSFMVGEDFWNYARGYGRVDVFQDSLGNDTAWLFGTEGDDVLQADAEDATLTLSDGKIIAAHSFAATRVVAGAGNDEATFLGVANSTDGFLWTPDSAEMTSVRDATIVVTEGRGFEKVTAMGGDDGDRARLLGSESDDTLIALPEVAQLTTPNASVMVHDFGVVQALGAGGEDFAHLEDSRFNDNYVGKPNYSYMSGPGYLNLISQFEVIDAAATNGGYDFAYTIFETTIYTVVGGQNSLPSVEVDGETTQVGQFELTTIPGLRINVFTQDDLDNNRVVYVHSEENDDPFDIDIDLRVVNGYNLEETIANIQFPVNKDGFGKRFEVTRDDITGMDSITQPLETNFFYLELNQFWSYGTNRNERVFGVSRYRSAGPGSADLTPPDEAPYFIGTRVSQNGQIRFAPLEWTMEIETRNETPVANYDLVDGELVNVGNATLNPPVIDW